MSDPKWIPVEEIPIDLENLPDPGDTVWVLLNSGHRVPARMQIEGGDVHPYCPDATITWVTASPLEELDYSSVTHWYPLPLYLPDDHVSRRHRAGRSADAQDEN